MGALVCALLALFNVYPPRCPRPEPPPPPPPAAVGEWSASTSTLTLRVPCDPERWCGCTLTLPGGQVVGYQLDEAPRVDLEVPARGRVTCEEIGISSAELAAAEVVRIFGAQP